jgi:hypothetical protein
MWRTRIHLTDIARWQAVRRAMAGPSPRLTGVNDGAGRPAVGARPPVRNFRDRRQQIWLGITGQTVSEAAIP